MNELHQILAEIETNLKDLESARNQVELVSSRSDRLNNSTKELIERIREFVEKTKNININFNNDYKNLLEYFKSELEKLIKDSKNKTDEENKIIRKLIVTFIHEINHNFDNFNNKLEQTLVRFNDELKNISSSFEKTTKMQASIVNNAANSFKNLLIEQNNEYNNLKEFFIRVLKKQNRKNTYSLIGIIILIISNIIIIIRSI